MYFILVENYNYAVKISVDFSHNDFILGYGLVDLPLDLLKNIL